MPDVRVEVDAETADALQVECELLGFDAPDAYLAWIVENRAAIEQGTESAELLAAYRERLTVLEDRLQSEGIDPVTVDPGSELSDSQPPEDESGTDSESESEPTSEPAVAPASGTSTQTASTSSSSGADDTPREAAATDAASSSDALASASTSADSPDEFSGSLTTGESSATAAPDADRGASPDDASPDDDSTDDASTDDGSTDDSPDDASPDDSSPTATATASDGGTRTDADITSMHLRPERIQRVNEDPVAKDAGELSNVTTKRVDEFSRRAVAETRQQLDRDVETGLSYESSAAMSQDVRPGEDLADLGEIDVPGRSEELVVERRGVVGRALAHLRDEGSARRAEFVDALYEDHAAGYETADSWWRCVREGLSQVDAVDGGHVWEYVE